MDKKLTGEEWRMIEKWLEMPSFVGWSYGSNDEDEAYWEKYLNNNPEHWELAKIAKSISLGIPFHNIPQDSSGDIQALNALKNRIARNRKYESRLSSTRKLKMKTTWWVAASILVLAIFSSVYYFYFIHNPKITLSTNFGGQTETILPDGSLVTLNSNTVLSYQKQKPRKVYLDGEAYFEIVKITETNEEFEVVTPDLSVIVLGTSFNINTRNDQTEVMLEEGKVVLNLVDTMKSDIEMLPGDLITYSKKNDNLKESRGNAPAFEVAAWKEGTLLFRENTPLTEALFEIEDIYGIQFVIQTDAIKNETINGGVPIRDLQVTLSTLTEIYGLNMNAVGKRYFITSKD